ncbi:MAG TPA: GEVED domain-containing protein, partial [Bacteroidia bacterium]|nr:GEVED domain-containing protein [Bacteroidia bacterium]
TTTTLLLNSTYDLRVTTTFNAIVSVWFDFDRSGTFDPTEWYQVNVSASPNVVSSTLFIVPGTASVGTTKMRIRCRAAGTPNGAIDACTNFFSGETEDYTITLDDGTRIQSYESEASLFLAYPNPATDHISLQPRTALHNAKIEIHDLNGKSEYSNSSENIMQGSSTEIDLTGLSSGIYILTCRSNEGIQHHRIQVIR